MTIRGWACMQVLRRILPHRTFLVFYLTAMILTGCTTTSRRDTGNECAYHREGESAGGDAETNYREEGDGYIDTESVDRDAAKNDRDGGDGTIEGYDSKSFAACKSEIDITRQKILEEARKIVLTEGLSGFSMRVLAARIDYSPSAIYKYFANKQEILMAIREEGFAIANSMNLSRLAEDLPMVEKLYNGGKSYLEFADKYPEYYRLMFDCADVPAGAPAQVSAHPNFAGFIALVDAGVRSRAFRLPKGYTPELMAFHIWMTIHGMVMLRISAMKNARKEFDELCETLMRTFIATIASK